MRPYRRLAQLTLAAAALGCVAAGGTASRPVAADRVAAAVPALPAPTADESVAVARIIREGMEASRTAADLRYLTDVLGPRLTGSEAMRRANDWTAERFREYGADSAWLEPYRFGVGWQRGPLSLRLVLPHRRELLGASWGWAPGTDGPRAGDVVVLQARNEREYRDRHRGRVRGAWVLAAPPYPVGSLWTSTSRLDAADLAARRRAAQPADEAERRFRYQRLIELLADEGIAGVLHDGAKPFGLFTMSGSPIAVLPYPQIVIGNDVYSELYRLAQSGERVRVEADVRNTIGQESLTQWNTVAEIRGSVWPDEVVLLGAHLDSWDLGTGATDNGAACIAILEAARLLSRSGLRPKRTIRFVLFSGEEQGLLGSEAYARTHRGALSRYQAVLVLDNGAGRITGMALQGQDVLAPLWSRLFQPLVEVGPLAVRSGFKTGTDHLSFLAYGVPSFNYDQLTRAYDHTHHSQVDVLDNVVPEDVAQAATVLAVNALQLANLSMRLPRP